MRRPTRRRLLSIAGGSLGTGLGISLTNSGSGSGAKTSPPSAEIVVWDGDGEEPTLDVLDAGASMATPAWYDAAAPTVGALTVIDSPERAEETIVDVRPVDPPDAVEAALAEVDYDESVVLLIESVGPDACYDTVEVKDVRVADDQFTAQAAVTADDGFVCAQVITFPAVIAVVTPDTAPPTTATVHLTDGWGETAELTATADDPPGVTAEPTAVDSPITSPDAGVTATSRGRSPRVRFEGDADR